jgi:hypothetical protein
MTAPEAQPRPADKAAPATASPLTDEAALLRLLDLAGPAGAPALLDQIHADLQTVLSDVTTALSRGDRALLRSATHVLMALAGTVGAPRLHAAALAANLAAHAGDSRALSPAATAGLTGDLASLIDDIARRRRWRRQA